VPDPSVGVRLQAFNWRLWEARRDAGFTQAELGLLIGSHAQRIGVIETLRSRPTADEQEEIAAALNVARAELFPPEVLELYGPLPSTIRLKVPASRLRALRDMTAESPLEQLLPRDVLGAEVKALLSLSPREQYVVIRRFGLDGEGVHTLEAIGREYGVTGVRVNQIEAKALRKLRNPRLSKKLVGLLDSSSYDGMIPKKRHKPLPSVKSIIEQQRTEAAR
jgi:transcriptional regulator with XRE-family HTH domain